MIVKEGPLTDIENIICEDKSYLKIKKIDFEKYQVTNIQIKYATISYDTD